MGPRLSGTVQKGHWHLLRSASPGERFPQLVQPGAVPASVFGGGLAKLTLCPAVDEPWIWALLTLAPLPPKRSASRPLAWVDSQETQSTAVHQQIALREKLQRECLQVPPHGACFCDADTPES